MMSRLNIFRGVFLAAILFIGVRAEYNNAKLEQETYHFGRRYILQYLNIRQHSYEV